MGEETSMLAMWLLTVALVAMGFLPKVLGIFPTPLVRTAKAMAPVGWVCAALTAVALRLGT